MIKKFLRGIVIEAWALYLANNLVLGLGFTQGIRSLLLTAVALAVAGMFIKPIINIFLLPINLVTFNFFRWASHAVMLFLVDLVLTEFSIGSFRYGGFSSDYLSLPPIFFESGIAAYLAFSILIGLIAGIFHWIMEK